MDAEVIFENFIVYHNRLWFTDIKSNGFYYYDFSTEETVLICEILEEEPKGRLFGSIILEDNIVYLIPFTATSMYKINLETKDYRKITFRSYKEKSEDNHYVKFLSAHKYENKIYMIPSTYPAIVEYDCETERMAYYDSWMQDIKRFIRFDEKSFFRKSLLIDKKIYIPLCVGNAVLIFDLEKKQQIFKEVGSKKCSFSDICYDGQEFWLLPRRTGSFVRWNERLGKYKEIKNNICTSSSEPVFNAIIYFDHKIIILLSGNNKVYGIDSDKNEILEYNNYTLNNDSCLRHYKSNDMLYLFSFQSRKLYTYSESNGKFDCESIKIPKDYFVERQKRISATYRLIHGLYNGMADILSEDYKDALDEYIKYIVKQNTIENSVLSGTVENNIFGMLSDK